jgi:DNA-binding CsgD family transcriptional regulator
VLGSMRQLLERDQQLAGVLAAAEAARAGAGRLVLIEAAAGLGKTSLLTSACELLAADGHTVLSARGSEMEHEYGYGVVRQLLERTLADPLVRDRVLTGAAAAVAPLFDSAVEGDVTAFAVLHGLYWAVANLAQDGMLVLAVDDAQLADAASLRFLVYLARRISDLGVLLLVAARPAAQTGPNLVLDELRREAGGAMLRLAPLSVDAVAHLVHDALGVPPDTEFSTACARATGGNPFYVEELLRDVAGRGVVPTSGNADVVGRSGPPSIVRGLLLRMGTLPSGALPLARACAVLGPGHRLADCAELAALSLDEAAAAADALAAAGFLAPSLTLEFRHPILEAAVLSDLGAHEERRWHSRAADLLAAAGADARHVAAHLLRCDPVGDPATVTVLCAAAAAAARSGAPAAAAAYLRRALAEPPTDAERAEVLYLLGTAEAALGDDAAAEHLAAGIAATADPVAKAARSAFLADVTARAGRLPAALTILTDAINALGDRPGELQLTLEATRFFTARLDLRTSAQAERYRAELEAAADGPDSSARRQLMVYLAIDAAAGRSRRQAAALLERALAPPGLLQFVAPEAMAVGMALFGLSAIEQHADFDVLADQTALKAGERGALMANVSASMFRAMEYLHRGRLVEAEAEARAALGAPGRRGWHQSAAGLVALLGVALFEQGRYDESKQVLTQYRGDRDDARDYTTMLLLDLRGRLRIADGSVRAGLDDIIQCGRRADEYAMCNPALLPWRNHAVFAHLALGDRDEAIRLANAELEFARRLAGPIAEAAALRALAQAGSREERIERLRSALELLDGPSARLERARVLTDLGAAERRTGLSREAKASLAEALELATVCHAAPVAERARSELLAAGARPRRTPLHGRDALTASEARVARLAAQGLSNTAIAQTLFISRKTVEKHLANAYRKLGIASRGELDAAAFSEPAAD